MSGDAGAQGNVEEGAVKPKAKPPTPRTLVFDEIDIGIGGRAAEAVGQKLKSLGAQAGAVRNPLPQIAAFADSTFSSTSAKPTAHEDAIRLLDDRAACTRWRAWSSGAKVSETSLQHAAQMIAGAVEVYDWACWRVWKREMSVRPYKRHFAVFRGMGLDLGLSNRAISHSGLPGAQVSPLRLDRMT